MLLNYFDVFSFHHMAEQMINNVTFTAFNPRIQIEMSISSYNSFLQFCAAVDADIPPEINAISKSTRVYVIPTHIARRLGRILEMFESKSRRNQEILQKFVNVLCVGRFFMVSTRKKKRPGFEYIFFG